ncbi:MAG TPA: hypothetical protein VNO86_03390 [Candidatus Binatia bacterium]|nr:hypothetical protein [Candidatus Binatia bacterium]
MEQGQKVYENNIDVDEVLPVCAVPSPRLKRYTYGEGPPYQAPVQLDV